LKKLRKISMKTNMKAKMFTLPIPSFVLLFLTLFAASAIAHGPARGPASDPTSDAKSESTPDRHIQFPDTSEYRTLAVDLHTHSVFSDGHVWPKIRVEEALRDGLDALAITEHLEYQPHRADLIHPDRNRSFEIAKDAAENQPLIVIAGSEITREAPAGHINAVFINDANKLLNVKTPQPADTDAREYYLEAGKWPAQDAVDAAASQGAFLFWNHPYWTAQQPDGIARINDFHANNAKNNKLHGIEIANGQDYSEEAHQIAMDHNLAFIGVSDIHDLIDWDYPPSEGQHRPVTLVFASDASAESIRDALFAKRTVVWFRNLLIGREAELLPLIDASIDITSAKYRTDNQLLDLTIQNNSDAYFLLRNRSNLTFMHGADLVRLKPNSATSLVVKPGTILDEISLSFIVENALTAPKANPTIELTAKIAAGE
jgi:hypothetical protein